MPTANREASVLDHCSSCHYNARTQLQHTRHGVGFKARPTAPVQQCRQASAGPAAANASGLHPAVCTRCGRSPSAFLKPLIRPCRLPQCLAAGPPDRWCHSICQGERPAGGILCPDPDPPLATQRPHKQTDDNTHSAHGRDPAERQSFGVRGGSIARGNAGAVRGFDR